MQIITSALPKTGGLGETGRFAPSAPLLPETGAGLPLPEPRKDRDGSVVWSLAKAPEETVLRASMEPPVREREAAGNLSAVPPKAEEGPSRSEDVAEARVKAVRREEPVGFAPAEMASPSLPQQRERRASLPEEDALVQLRRRLAREARLRPQAEEEG